MYTLWSNSRGLERGSNSFGYRLFYSLPEVSNYHAWGVTLKPSFSPFCTQISRSWVQNLASTNSFFAT